MSIKLNAADFQRLTRIVEAFPEIALSRERLRFVQSVFNGVPNDRAILNRIEYEGTAMGFATHIVKFLADFGQVAPGQEALGLFLDQLLVNTGGGDQANAISQMMQTYNMKPVAAALPVSLPAPTPLSGAESKYVFISYARPDSAVADAVETYLLAAGFRVFRDRQAIEVGDNWDMTIEKALNEATHMVVLLSAASMPYRKEVYREWFAFDQWRKPILPLLIQDATLHSRFLSNNYADGRTDLSGALKQLVQTLV